jgi:membrane dipeptidase
MASSGIGDDLIFIDACFGSRWDTNRSVLEHAFAGGLAAGCGHKVSYAGFDETMAMIAGYKAWFEENNDVVRQVYTVDDIYAAKRENRLGIYLGFQNTSELDDKLYYMRLFHELGVRVVQLTYSTANSVGGGCYESHDLPLTDYGREVVAELNRLGILIDLSHCGAQTATDAIAASSKPVAYTHTCPAALRTSRRNKTDAQMKDIAEHGGVIGIAAVLAFLKANRDATIDDYVETIEHVIGVAGEEHVAIGTDIRITAEKPEYPGADHNGGGERGNVSRDKGYARWYISEDNYGSLPYDDAHYSKLMDEKSTPTGMDDLSTRGHNLVSTMEKRGWSDDRIANILGRNWIRLFTEVWAAGAPVSD